MEKTYEMLCGSLSSLRYFSLRIIMSHEREGSIDRQMP